MLKRRRFSADFKRQVVEELLSGVSTPAQLIRRYEISSGLLYHWKKRYTNGAFEDESRNVAALEDRISQLEQMLGKATLENEFLKRAVRRSLEQAERKESSLPTISTCFRASKGGATS